MPSIDKVTQIVFQMPYFTNLPGDVVTNVFHAVWGGSGDPGPTECSLLGNPFDTFYEDVYAALGLANYCNKAGAHLTYYNLQDPTPRVPILDQSLSLANAAIATTQPTEVAVTLSFHGDYISGISAARQRGRVFIGGTGTVCTASTSGSFPYINATATGQLCDAMEQLKTDMDALDWTWVVYSPTQNAALGQETFPVVAGWVDNTPDTQRRRGVETTTRSLWP